MSVSFKGGLAMTVKVKEGGYYRCRDGRVVGPATRGSGSAYEWNFSGSTRIADGKFFASEKEHCLDLVSEVLVTNVLGFELKAGERYVLDSGEVVIPEDSGFTSPGVHSLVPFACRLNGVYSYISPDGRVIASARADVPVRQIVSKLKEPTIAERLEEFKANVTTEQWSRFDTILADVRKLEGKC